MKKLIISIDFDGCLVSLKYPQIGVLQFLAKEVLCKWHRDGHRIIVNTCRAHERLDAVINWLKDERISVDAINENLPDVCAMYGGETRKISADIYFDDKSMGGFCGWEKADEYVSQYANRKPVIICLVGESGGGKTSLCDYLESRFGLVQIESYTDRPKRHEGETGHTFVDKADFDLLKQEDMIAYTNYGDSRYCCLKDDVGHENTYTISEDGLLHLMANFRDVYDIKSIRVKCDEEVRLLRSHDKKRVERDRGRFTLPDNYFNFVVDTTNLEEDSYGLEFDRVIASWLKRGWNY